MIDLLCFFSCLYTDTAKFLVKEITISCIVSFLVPFYLIVMLGSSGNADIAD